MSGKVYSEWEIAPRERLRKLQEKKMLKIVEYAYERSPFYKKKFDEAGIKPGDITSLEDFYKKIPYTSKNELVKSQRNNPPYGDFLTVPKEKIRLLFISPGPIFEPYTGEDIKIIRKNLAKTMYTAGATEKDICQVTLSYHFMPAGLFIHWAAEEAGCTVIPAGTGESRMQVDFMKKAGTTIYAGTPTFLKRLGEEAVKMNINPKKDLKLRIGLCGAEPLPMPLRKDLEETFGIELFDAYGVAELGVMSRECEYHNGMHLNEELFLVEMIDPKTLEKVAPGEEGEIVATTLEREAMPLIRYRTGDASAMTEETCVCGRTEARILGIRGRVDMLTKVKGVFIHPKQAQEVVEKFPELGRLQIIVERPEDYDQMIIYVECKESSKFAEWENKLKTEFKQALRIKTDVKMVNPGEIPVDARILEDRRKHYTL
ncbi:MAG: phenylacetate--CoA ligase family protein [Candidatus Jordarchaeum sp.]|uniref:phenylacetate--CoA ligase family protein n=1 Tax=Candidatus Jordarchaeum sp. TaxID=2823881 RepID=UPI004049374F